jgi:hypothetical protein
LAVQLAWLVWIGLVLASPGAHARKPSPPPAPDRLEIDDAVLAGVLADPQHEFTLAQMEALVDMAARERTHIYNLFAAIALELAEHDVSATVPGAVMRALLEDYDLGGEDGAACFASERHRRIRMGRSRDDAEKVEIVFTMSDKGLVWVKDVPEKYTLRLAEEWGFADVSAGTLDGMFGIRGGWSIFTFRLDTYGLVEGGTMTMKFRTSRPIPVDVHRIRRR